jgi:hypothetical protein
MNETLGAFDSSVILLCSLPPLRHFTSETTCVAFRHEEHATNLDSCVQLPTARSSDRYCKEKFVEPA